MSDATEFFADNIGRETGAEEHSIERGDFLFVEGAAQVREATFEALADKYGFVGISEDGGEGGIDMFVGYATASEFACDAEAALAAGLRVVTSVFEGVASVVEVVQFAQAGDHGRDEFFFLGATLEILLHFMDREGAAHESALSGHVELVFGTKFPCGFGSHG